MTPVSLPPLYPAILSLPFVRTQAREVEVISNREVLGSFQYRIISFTRDYNHHLRSSLHFSKVKSMVFLHFSKVKSIVFLHFSKKFATISNSSPCSNNKQVYWTQKIDKRERGYVAMTNEMPFIGQCNALRFFGRPLSIFPPTKTAYQTSQLHAQVRLS